MKVQKPILRWPNTRYLLAIGPRMWEAQEIDHFSHA